jgi:Fe-S cluster assembly scaffold protein SufB
MRNAFVARNADLGLESRRTFYSKVIHELPKTSGRIASRPIPRNGTNPNLRGKVQPRPAAIYASEKARA